MVRVGRKLLIGIVIIFNFFEEVNIPVNNSIATATEHVASNYSEGIEDQFK
jgi:hypothetical protein